jgi:hypothetical protein
MKKIAIITLMVTCILLQNKVQAQLRSTLTNEKEVADKIAETSYIEFHSNYFINLHHFIFNKAMRYSFYKSENQKQFDSLFVEIKYSVDEKSKAKIMSAVKYYADSLSRRNMLFDEELTSFKYALQQSQSYNELKTKTTSFQIISAMKSADAFFKKYYWNEQNKKNKDFILASIETIKKIEEEVMANCSQYYQYKFNGKKFRVDLTDYATFFSAYTTNEPYVSAIISSTNKKHEGNQGIEVIFHEISHAMIDSVYNMQQKICSEKNLKFDHNVWHSILFYSTGTFVKNALLNVGQKHEMYLYKNKLADFNPVVKKMMEAIAIHWQNFLDGKSSMQDSMHHILL